MSTVEEQLAWEAEQRPRASAVAIAAGVLGLIGFALLAVLRANGPQEKDGYISVTEALGARLQGSAPSEPSLFLRQALYYGERTVPFTLSTLLSVLSIVLTGLTLAFLYRALVARAPDTGKLPIVMVVIGTVASAVGLLVRDLAIWIGTAGLASDATIDDAQDALQGSLVLAGELVRTVGSLALGVGFALVALNAMRAGLLPRFLGILGVVVGVLAFIQLDQPQIIRAFWLISVGFAVIAGRGKAGLLPAWQTGRAEPWPTQQELREQREGARSGAAPAAPQAAKGGAVSSAEQARRKRKKRR